MTAQREVRVTAEKCMDYGMAAMGRQVDQQTAQYNPLGGTDTQACANCLFFMSPNGCTVVESWPAAISPTGLSKYWTAIPAPDDYPPMRVVIVEDEAKELDAEVRGKGLIDRIVAAVKSAFAASAPAGPEGVLPLASEGAASAPSGAGAFRLYKSTEGEWRWVALVSNKYRDRDNKENGPEIIEEAAHVEYVGYLDKTGDYPEAWLWHTPGTRWGKADWADYADGFLLMSGTVDKGMEDVAEALEGEALGVSHGFYQRYSNAQKGIIGWYRTFEVSALPPEAAANPWTALSVIRKEAAMPISAAKRPFIEAKLGKGRVAELEGDVGALAKALQDAGVEYKDLLEAGNETPTISAKDIADAITKAMEPTTNAVQALTSTAEATKTVAEATAVGLLALSDRVKALERSDDEKIAAQFVAKSADARNGGGYRASEKNGIDKEHDDLPDATPVLPQSQQEWLTKALPFAGG